MVELLNHLANYLKLHLDYSLLNKTVRHGFHRCVNSKRVDLKYGHKDVSLIDEFCYGKWVDFCWLILVLLLRKTKEMVT